MMTFHELNLLPLEALKKQLFKCCGSHRWVEKMLPFFPMEDLVELLDDAEEQWYECTDADWKEAFGNHPKIGDTHSLQKKFAGTAAWSAGEQSNVAEAPAELLQSLSKGNELYEQKFGFNFIISATGKPAAEILESLQARLQNEPSKEIQLAAEEQVKIMQLRIQKLLL